MIDDPNTPKQIEPVNPPVPPTKWWDRSNWVVIGVIVLIAVMVWLVR